MPEKDEIQALARRKHNAPPLKTPNSTKKAISTITVFFVDNGTLLPDSDNNENEEIVD